jgi:hypothetical protein
MNKKPILILVFVIFSLTFILANVRSILISSSNHEFNATPEVLYLNWTNNWRGNISLISNTTGLILKVGNSSLENTIRVNYSQPIAGSYNIENCGYYPPYTGIMFEVINASGYSISNTTILSFLDITNMTIIPFSPCPSGRYYGMLNVTNVTNPNEFINITVIIDYPISSRVTNDLNLTTGVGRFKGGLPANALTYQSYFFNTSEIENATSVMVRLSWSDTTKDADLFLFDDSGNLVAKSINKTTTEQVVYNYLPKNKWWEIRLFANSTAGIDYSSNSFVVFSTLNVTNSSNPNQQFAAIDFGNMYVGNKSTVNVTLKNEGGLILSNVRENKEVYYIKTFASSSGSSNFSFIVPAFASNLRASVNWTGTTNYTINLFKPDNTLVGISADKRYIANVSKAMQEEYVENIGLVGSNNEGIWRLEVRNTTNTTSPYTVNVKFWVNESEWIGSNYSAVTFNSTNLGNYSQNYHFNFTVPANSIDGTFQGYIYYRSDSGSLISIPLNSNVKTAVLMVNSSINSTSTEIKENIGFNINRIINIPISNNGTLPLTFGLSRNSTSLNYGNYYMNFSYNYPDSLSAGSSDYLNVSINIDTTKTNNTEGIYVGWIFLNSSDSRPYQGFNLIVRVNLTSELNVNIIGVSTSDGNLWIENTTIPGNLTLQATVYYINGSPEIKELPLNNFISGWLTEESSGTSYRIPTSGYLTTSNYVSESNESYFTNRYRINLTSFPTNQPGGNYTVYLSVSNITNNVTLNGIGSNSSYLRINNIGLEMSPISSTSIGTINEGSSTYFNVSVKNFGTLTASGATITFNKGSCYNISVESYTPYNCTGTSGITPSGNTFTFTMNGNETNGCYFSWKLTADSVTSDKSCSDASITGTSLWFNNITGISMDINNIDGGSSGTTTTTVAEVFDVTTTTTITIPEVQPVYLDFFEYPTEVSIEQGSNKTEEVVVQNVNESEEQSIRLEVLSINSSWYKVSPNSSIMIEPEEDYTYRVIFIIPEEAVVDDYAGRFKASGPFEYITTNFTLTVLPGTRLKEEINRTLANYQQRLLELEKELNQTRAKGGNTTDIESKLAILKGKFLLAIEFRDDGDYKSAYTLLDDIETLLNETSTELHKITIRKNVGNVVKVSVISIGAISAVILAYLFWPTKVGYDPDKGYLYKLRSKDLTERIHHYYRKLKEKWKRFGKRDGYKG